MAIAALPALPARGLSTPAKGSALNPWNRRVNPDRPYSELWRRRLPLIFRPHCLTK